MHGEDVINGLVSMGTAEQFDDAAKFLNVLGNKIRLEILFHLLDGEKSVGEICSLIGLKQSATSQHLAKLKSIGILRYRRETQFIYYSVNMHRGHEIFYFLNQIRMFRFNLYKNTHY